MKKKPGLLRRLGRLILKSIIPALVLASLSCNVVLFQEQRMQRAALEQIVPAILYLLQSDAMHDKGM